MAEPAGNHRREVSPVWAALRGGVIVSCQAAPGHPMRRPEVIARIAEAVVGAGAVGIRIDTPEHIAAVKRDLDATVIGLWKDGQDGVYITPTLEHARAVVRAGADVVAVDGTRRPRPDGRSLGEVVQALHAEFGAIVLADVATVAEGVAAVGFGADAVATTLAGHTGDGVAGDGPAIETLAQLTARLNVPVIAEGGIVRPDQVREAFQRGAWSVVIGKAITSPDWITMRFVEATSRLQPGPTRPAVVSDGLVGPPTSPVDTR